MAETETKYISKITVNGETYIIKGTDVNVVTTDTAQTISGSKTFTGTIRTEGIGGYIYLNGNEIRFGNDSEGSTWVNANGIIRQFATGDSTPFTIRFPASGGTLALTSDNNVVGVYCGNAGSGSVKLLNDYEYFKDLIETQHKLPVLLCTNSEDALDGKIIKCYYYIATVNEEFIFQGDSELQYRAKIGKNDKAGDYLNRYSVTPWKSDIPTFTYNSSTKTLTIS